MFRQIGLKKTAAALIAGVALSVATIGAAQADPWRHDRWHGGGWGRGAVIVGPSYYYAPPPPVYYAPPPPVYYAPPPPVYYAPPPPVYVAPVPAVSLQFRL